MVVPAAVKAAVMAVATRSAHYPGLPDSHQAVGTVALVYTLLGKTGFGAVK